MCVRAGNPESQQASAVSDAKWMAARGLVAMYVCGAREKFVFMDCLLHDQSQGTPSLFTLYNHRQFSFGTMSKCAQDYSHKAVPRRIAVDVLCVLALA